MGDIVNFEKNMPHIVSEVICVRCASRWISVRPTITLLKDLECNFCHKSGGVIETGQDLDIGGENNE